METGITTERLLGFAFSLIVVALGAAMCRSKLLTGSDWVTLTTWVTGALLLGRAAAVAASGYAVTAQAKTTAMAQAKAGASS